MSNKIKLLLFVICSVVVAALGLVLDTMFGVSVSNPIVSILIMVCVPAVLYAVFCEKLDFCNNYSKSAFIHALIWLVLIELSILISDLLDDSEEKKQGMTLGLGWLLLIGVGLWLLTIGLSDLFIRIRNKLQRNKQGE